MAACGERPCVLIVSRQWADLLRDLDRLQEATIEKEGRFASAERAAEKPPGLQR